nr:hypothetical protein [Tanacetum cinerariifolium]
MSKSQPKSIVKSAQVEETVFEAGDTQELQNQRKDMGLQVVHVDYFINNDLKYLRGGSSSKKYTTYTTKTRDAKYDILCIEDMVPSFWSPSTETSKGMSKSQPKSIVKSAQAEETVFEAGDTQELQNQRKDMGNTDDQPNVKAPLKHD